MTSGTEAGRVDRGNRDRQPLRGLPDRGQAGAGRERPGDRAGGREPPTDRPSRRGALRRARRDSRSRPGPAHRVRELRHLGHPAAHRSGGARRRCGCAGGSGRRSARHGLRPLPAPPVPMCSTATATGLCCAGSGWPRRPTPRTAAATWLALADLCHDPDLGQGPLVEKLSALADAARAGRLDVRELARRLATVPEKRSTAAEPGRAAADGHGPRAQRSGQDQAAGGRSRARRVSGGAGRRHLEPRPKNERAGRHHRRARLACSRGR